MNPNFPIYILSKGRWESRLTSKALERMGVPYSIVVEEQERDAYAAVIDPAKIMILDPEYQRVFDPMVELREGQSKGSGPARNFIWDHAISIGAEWHWVIDDNIRDFYRLNRNMKIRVYDGVFFRIMEDFVLRYTNVGMAGPNYEMFVPRRLARPPFTLNTRIYSCILIRNSLPFRWRGRYNEDTDLSLRVLKAGWCTVLFNAFLADKMATQRMKGGNTDAFYAEEGTLPKSKLLVSLHPDVTKLLYKWGRWHHLVNYKPFQRNKLIRRSDLLVDPAINEYGMRMIDVGISGDKSGESGENAPE